MATRIILVVSLARPAQVPLPDAEARLDFFRLVLQRPELAAAHAVVEDDLAELVRATHGCTGADMQHISREAAMRAGPGGPRACAMPAMLATREVQQCPTRCPRSASWCWATSWKP